MKERIEQADEGVANRQKVFSATEKPEKEEGKVPEGQTGEGDAQMKQPGMPAEENMDKFKKVSFELLDISLYYTQQGVEKVKSQPLYQRVDAVVNFDDKFALVKKHGEELFTLLDERFRPLVEKVFFLYDQATN